MKKKILKSVLIKKQKRKERSIQKNLLKEWSKSVKERDNYTCQLCNKDLRNGSPQDCNSHHILDKLTWPEFKLDINNGITLCYRDHRVSKYAPHLNALAFIIWLYEYKLSQFNYLVRRMNESL